MYVICSHILGVETRADLKQSLVDFVQFGNIVAHQLKKKSLPPEQVKVEFKRLDRLVLLAIHQEAGRFAPQTGRSGDQSLVVLDQQVVVNAGVVVETFKLGSRGQLE